MTASEIRIREAKPEDIDSITVFQQAMAQETEGKTLDSDLLREGITAVFRSPSKGFYLVAESEG